MNDSHYQLGFIGAGKLASSVIRGLLLKKYCSPEAIIASEPNPDAREELRGELGIRLVSENSEAAEKAEIVFLGVKPQMVLPVLRELTIPDKLVASFAAGIRIASMESATSARVMRVLTNTPSAIGRAATAFAAGTRSSNKDREQISAIFSAIGLAVEVKDEQIDAVTALSGSGPAFVYSMIEALAEGGAKNGLPAEAALKLAAQTALGAADLMLTSGKTPEELRRMVVTAGGTTAAGLEAMKKNNASTAIISAVEAAALRGREMAQEFGG